MPIIGGGIVGGGGSGTSDSTTEGRIPVKSSGTFVNSKLKYDSANDKIVSDTTIEVPAGTIELGDATTLSEGLQSLVLRDKVQDEITYLVKSQFNTAGTGVPRYFKLGAEFTLNVQPDDTFIITDNPLNYSIVGTVVSPDVRQINRITYRTAAAMTNTRVRITDNSSGVVIRYIPDKAAWESGTGGLDLITGDNIIDLLSTDPSSPGTYNLGVSPFLVQDSQQLDFTIAADSVAVLGDGTQVPYQIALAQDGPLEPLAEAGAASPGGNSTNIQFNNLGSFDGTDDFIWNDSAKSLVLNQKIDLRSTLAGTTSTLTFQSNDGLTEYLRLSVGETAPDALIVSYNNADMIIQSDGTMNITAFDDMTLSTVGDFLLNFNNPTSNFTIQDSASNNVFEFDNALNSNLPLVLLSKSGTNPASAQIFVSPLAPNGVVTGNGGDLCILDNGTGSELYIKLSDGGNTGWQKLLHGTTGVQGPGSSTDNSIATWDGTTGLLLQDNPLLRYESTTGTSSLSIQQNTTGTADLFFLGSTGFAVGLIQSLSGDLIIDAVGSASSELSLSGSGDLTLSSVNGDVVSRKAFNIDALGVSASATLNFRSSTDVDRFTIEFNDALDRVSMISAASTEIDIVSSTTLLLESNGVLDIANIDDTSVIIRNDLSSFTLNGATGNYSFSFTNQEPNTEPLLILAKDDVTGGVSRIYVTNTAPEGVIAADGGSICFLDDDTNSNVYLKTENVTNTGWQSLLGDVVGPASSTDSALTLWDGTTGKLVKSSGYITVNETIDTEIRLKSQSATSTIQMVFESFNGSRLTILEYDEVDFETSLILTGANHSFLLEVQSAIEIKSVSGSNVSLQNDNSGYIAFSSVQNYIQQISNNQPNTNPLIQFLQSGTNGGISDWYFSTVAPEGVITAEGGDICVVDAGTNSDIYLKRTDTGNTGWVDLLHGASGVKGPATSTDNAIATWDGTTGLLLQDSNSSLSSTATSTILSVSNLTTTGQSGYEIRNNLGTARYYVYYDQAASDVLETTNSGTSFTGIYDGTLQLTSLSNVAIGSDNDQLLEFYNPNATLRLDTAANGGRLFFSNTTADTNEMIRLQKTGTNGGICEIYTTSRTPTGNITANGGDIAIRDSGADSNLYLKRVDGGTTGWNVALTNQTESSTLNAIAKFDSTSGNSLAPVNTATVFSDAQTTSIEVRPTAVTGNAEVNYRSTTGALKVQTYYWQGSDVFYIDTDVTKAGMNNFGGPLAFGSSAADYDMYVRTSSPVGVVTGDPGDTSHVVSGTSSAIYLHEGSTSNNTDWYKLSTTNDIAFASVLRLDTDGNTANRTLSATPTQITDFTTNGPDTGILTSDQANNEIVITDVIDTVNGDVYEINFTISVQCGNTNREFILQVYSNNGVTDTATNIRTHSFFDSANELYTKSLSGHVRGPSSITGSGAFKIFFSSNDTGTVQFREMIFTAKRLL